MAATSTPVKPTVIVTFKSIAQFYDPDDPSPEKERGLSDRAEDQIGHSVLDTPDPLHAGTKDRLEIRLPQADLTPEREAAVPTALRSHFLRRAGELRRGMRLTQRIGLREFRLTVGICIPAFAGIVICDRFAHDPVAIILQNVLVIFSWVVIWQPFQSLVFDRWTLSEQAKVFLQIAAMEITVEPA